MRRLRGIILVNMVLLVLMVAFNNCGQPGEIRFNQWATNQPSSSVPNENNDQGVTPSPATDPVEPRPPVSPPVVIEEPRYLKVEKTITLSETQNADILFVIDNSVSMAQEQSNMSERFPVFIKNLMSIDWRIGIVTTDVDDPGVSYADGKLQAFANGKNYIDSKIPQSEAETLFAKNIQRTEKGSAYEQGIYATYRFLERERASKVPFMRGDASINVVFISDADESPYWVNGVPYFQKKNKSSELVKYLTQNWPMKKFQFHSIVVQDGDEDCLVQSENESYGVHYEALSKQTGGVIGSVCAKDYGSQLLFLSEKIKDLVNSITLDCAPVYDQQAKRYLFDIKYDGSHRIEVEKIEGRQVRLRGDLPVGTVKLEYFCSEMLSN